MKNPILDRFAESFTKKFSALVLSFCPQDPDRAVIEFSEKMQEVHAGIVNVLFRRGSVKRIYYREFLVWMDMTSPVHKQEKRLLNFAEYIARVSRITKERITGTTQDFDRTDWRETRTIQRYYFSYFAKWGACRSASETGYMQLEEVKKVEMKEFFDRLSECFALEKQATTKQAA